MEYLSDQIRALMKRREMTQQDLAKKLEVSQPSIAQAVSGKNISVRTLRRIADALGCDIVLLPREKE